MLLRIHSNDEDNVLSNGPRRSLHGLVALCVGLLLACTTQAQTKKPTGPKDDRPKSRNTRTSRWSPRTEYSCAVRIIRASRVRRLCP